MERKIRNSILELTEGDITEMDTDAIVNAANSRLQHGGGVAGAIVRKGGWIIQEESNKIGYVPVGEAAITTAGKLKTKYVIHAVGPVWRDGNENEDEKLKNATLNSLKLADRNNLRSIAFPAISAGIFGFPIDRCAKIMLSTTIEYLNEETRLERVIFCLYGKKNFEIFQKELEAS
ncbi:MAG: O-acetyl-ADP-ribose deacetylase [Dehalococcoidia bacterium CG2_30_46_9]|nr:MAG: O-acetyl-ADP-ribose deacetylase [Dehalococcoidia bacterium CG2_30_46_9]